MNKYNSIEMIVTDSHAKQSSSTFKWQKLVQTLSSYVFILALTYLLS